MKTNMRVLQFFVPAMLLLVLTAAAHAQDGERLTGSNLDARTTLFYRVAEPVLQKLIPAGWELSPPGAGPAAGMNLAVILVDNLMSHDGEGKLTANHRGAIVLAPVRKSGTKTDSVLILAGLMSEGNSPGAYGVYAPSRVSFDSKARTGADGKGLVEENWSMAADNGNTIEAVIHYARGPVTKVDRSVLAHGINTPDAYRIYKYESASDTLRSVPLKVDRVSRLEVRAGGPLLGPLFDGTQSLVAVVATPMYSRRVFVQTGK